MEIEDIDALGHYVQGTLPNDRRGSRWQDIQEFKTELRAAMDDPGRVTPALLDRWTDQEAESQEEVQAFLEDVWNACFPAEARHEVIRSSGQWMIPRPTRIFLHGPEFEGLLTESLQRVQALCGRLPDDAIYFCTQHYWSLVHVANDHGDPIMDFPDWPERIYARLKEKYFPDLPGC